MLQCCNSQGNGIVVSNAHVPGSTLLKLGMMPVTKMASDFRFCLIVGGCESIHRLSVVFHQIWLLNALPMLKFMFRDTVKVMLFFLWIIVFHIAMGDLLRVTDNIGL